LKTIFAIPILCCAVSLFAAAEDGQRKIPILISDHHADHALYLVRHFKNDGTALVVLDAHADTEKNEEHETISKLISAGDYNNADRLIKNHNWIHPLIPNPVTSLVWIATIAGYPDSNKAQGFLASTASWTIKNIDYINAGEIGILPIRDEALFVSIDLDFFYNKDYTPQDIPSVFNRLLDYSLNWKGAVVWALCLSRAWLPDDEYAWELLEQSLRWLGTRTEFEAPELTLFTAYRHDTSRNALAFRSEGTEPPGFYARENETPDVIRDLLLELDK